MDVRACWCTRARYTVFDSHYGDGAAVRVLTDVWRTDPHRSPNLHIISLCEHLLPGFHRMPQAEPGVTLDLISAPLTDALAQLTARVDMFRLHDIEHAGTDFARHVARVAAQEAKLIQEAIDKDVADKKTGHFDLKPWDWQRYAEKVRKARYDLDEEALKPYFELHKVLEDGVFYAATKLYGITFKKRTDIPVYHPDVMVYEVFDQDGSKLGLMYFDYFKRDNKSGGAWMSNFVGQSKLRGTRPVIYNVANFTKPAPGQPALISFDDAGTMFHEFGHALHGLFADQTYPLVSGTNVARDFVEFPSQVNEH